MMLIESVFFTHKKSFKQLSSKISQTTSTFNVKRHTSYVEGM